jgi:hypothetical protein
MGSRSFFAMNMGFATTLLVAIPSYYVCVRKRQYKEELIELMMRVNDFQHAKEMPPETPAGEDHPFLEPAETPISSEYVAHLPERKEWQKPIPLQDGKSIFVKKEN